MDYIALNHQPIKPLGIIYNSAQSIGGIRYYTPENQKVTVKQEADKKVVEVNLNSKKNPEEVLQEQPLLVAESLEPKSLDQKTEIKKITDQGTTTSNPNATQENEKELVIAQQKLAEQNKLIEQELIAINLTVLPKQEYFDKQKNLIQQKAIRLLGPMRRFPEYNARNPINSSIPTRKIQRYDGDYVINIQGSEVSFSDFGISRVEIEEEDRDWLKRAQNYFVSARENNIKIGSAQDYTSMEILEALWSTALNVGVEPKRFIVQLYNESRFNPHVVGSAGERGIGQFLRSTSDLLGYDWDKMSGGLDTFAYQAKASAEYLKSVGEISYNGSGPKARAYKEKISDRLSMINSHPKECVMKNINHCDT